MTTIWSPLANVLQPQRIVIKESPEADLSDLFLHNPAHLICVFHLRVRLDQVPRAVIVRVFTKYLPDRMAFDIRSAALVTLFKFHFLPAP